MKATEERQRIQEWLINYFKESVEFDIVINKDILISTFCLKFYKNQRYAIDLLKIFEMNGDIKIYKKLIEVLK